LWYHPAAVREKQGSGHRGIADVHVNGRPVLCSVQEDFSSEPAILEAVNAGRVPDATVQLMAAPIREGRHRGL
jgi:hypothetical protein